MSPQRFVANVDTHKLAPLLERSWPAVSAHSPRKGVLVLLAAAAAVAALLLLLGDHPILTAVLGAVAVLLLIRARAGASSAPAGARFAGTAGSVGAAGAKFGDKAQIGAEGERRTAALLALCDRVEGLHVFHGVRFPNSTRADIDHVLVYGNQIMLVDSKLFRGGCRYELVPGGDGQGPKQKATITSTCGPSHTNSMPSAVTTYLKRFPGCRVTGAIIVHGREATVRTPKGYRVSIHTPEQFFAQHLVSWLSSVTPRAANPAALRSISSELIG